MRPLHIFIIREDFSEMKLKNIRNPAISSICKIFNVTNMQSLFRNYPVDSHLKSNDST